jgi:2-oxoglutarate dehydrogenase E1 component
MQRMRKSSHLGGLNAAYIEDLYETYLEDPGAVAEVWRSYFETLPVVEGAIGADTPHSSVVQHFERLGRNRLKAKPEKVATHISDQHQVQQMRVQDLISAYRHRGHKRANIDPLGMMERPATPILELDYHRLSPADLDETFNTGTFHYGDGTAKLRDIETALQQTYCGSIGAEYMHIVDTAEQLWVQQRLESARSRPSFDNKQKQAILERLIAAEGLEKYLHRRYPGTKRFGLEGAESLIPMFHELLQRLGDRGVVESVIGMAHRGRLNVLVNILGKSPGDLFDEFDGNVQVESGSGDVKYHQGYSSNVMTRGGEMHLALAFNPSHLEIVGPVVEGSVRARQDRREDPVGDQVAPIVVHGDAAFAGQGVVMETFQMSQTRGFRTGGTIHIIINNQIGFTTDRQEDARSTEYCTEVAKLVQAPILHVNGDDPEAVIFATHLAADYRMTYRKDVVIDLVCYRRRGHNEGEEPMKTQPLMYQKIRSHPSVCEQYGDLLVDSGVIDRERVTEMADRYRDTIEAGNSVALSLVQEPNSELFVDWTPYIGHDWDAPGDTRVAQADFQRVAAKLEELPNGFVVHRQVAKILDDRHRMAAGAKPVNWGMAEVMAYATLVDAGFPGAYDRSRRRSRARFPIATRHCLIKKMVNALFR